MIRVIYEPDAPQIEVTGHAGAGDYGHDLVCAAASILCYTLQRALGEDGRVEIRSGKSRIRGKKAGADMRFETVMAGFEWLEENCREYVSVERTSSVCAVQSPAVTASACPPLCRLRRHLSPPGRVFPEGKALKGKPINVGYAAGKSVLKREGLKEERNR